MDPHGVNALFVSATDVLGSPTSPALSSDRSKTSQTHNNMHKKTVQKVSMYIYGERYIYVFKRAFFSPAFQLLGLRINTAKL